MDQIYFHPASYLCLDFGNKDFPDLFEDWIMYLVSKQLIKIINALDRHHRHD